MNKPKPEDVEKGKILYIGKHKIKGTKGIDLKIEKKSKKRNEPEKDYTTTE